MEPIRIGPFLGANKAIQAKQLLPGVGVESLNHMPDRGDLRPWRNPLTVATVGAARKTIEILGRDLTTDTIYWLEWTTLVNTVRPFIADNTTKRTYYTGSGPMKVTDNVLGLAGAPYPTSFRDVGVPKPLTAPTITQSVAGTGDDETRLYAYTYLTDWDEEGPPAISAPFTCKPGAILDITGMSLAPVGAGENRGIDRIRIYRTVAGDTGADFFFLRDIAIATSSQDDARAVGADTLPSAEWFPPPTDLIGLTPLWNGIMAGISKDAVRYCEPFKPHAWPAAYETLPPEKPLALGVFDKTMVVMTTGRPRIVYGTSPEAMDDTPVEFIAAIVSVPSAVSMGQGVCWATSDGLACVGFGGPPRLLTAGVMLLEDWQALNPETIVGCQYNGRYFGFYDTGSGWKGFHIDPTAPDSIYFLSAGYPAAHFDPLEEAMYVLDGTSVKKWDAGASFMSVTYRSKVFRLPQPANPGVAEIVADTYPVQFKLWAGKQDASGWSGPELVMDKAVAGPDAFTLPSGYLAHELQIEVSAATPISGVVVGEDIESIQQV